VRIRNSLSSMEGRGCSFELRYVYLIDEVIEIEMNHDELFGLSFEFHMVARSSCYTQKTFGAANISVKAIFHWSGQFKST